MHLFGSSRSGFIAVAVFGLIVAAGNWNILLGQSGFGDPNIDRTVYGLALQSDGKVLVGGDFNNAGGQARNKAARLNADGKLDTSFQDPFIGTADPFNTHVFALARQTDGKVIVGGIFSTAGGQPRNALARLNSDGTLDSSFNPTISGYVFSIAIQSDGKILIGGGFTAVNGQSRKAVARLNTDGSLDATFQDPNFVYPPVSPIASIAIQPDGKILVGGYFTSVGGQSRQYGVRLNSDGTVDNGFNFTASGPLSQFLVQPDGKILISGFFQTVNGVSRASMARLNADGTLDASFGNVAVPSGSVSVFALQADGKVVVSGSFSEISGHQRRDLARLNADGTFDATFINVNENLDDRFSTVNSILIQPDGLILVGGSFSSIGGEPRKNIVRLNADGTLNVAETPPVTFTVTKTADTNDGVCDADCSLREAVAKGNAAASALIQFDPAVFNVPQTITLVSGDLVVQNAGRFVINGPGANLLSISGNNASRILHTQRNGETVLSGLTFMSGNGFGVPAGGFADGSGGAIYAEGSGLRTKLTIRDSVITANQANTGAGLRGVSLPVTIENTIITGNTATYSPGGGGIYFEGATLEVKGSTISNNVSNFQNGGTGGIGVAGASTITLITNCSITGNTGSFGGGGLGLGGTATVTNSVISGNTSPVWGGGVYVSGTVELIGSTISGNTVTNSDSRGGGINNLGRLTLTNTAVIDNKAVFGGGIFTSGGLTANASQITANISSKDGGGIYNNAGGTSGLPVSLVSTTISDNKSSTFGGGIYNRDTTNLTGSTLSKNSATQGGGGAFNVFLNVGAAAFTATNSAITSNTSGAAAGGIQTQAGVVSLTNSTVGGNTANGLGGGISVSSNGTVNLTAVTIAQNTSKVTSGGGVNNTSGTITGRNSIIAGNFGVTVATPSDLRGSFTSAGYNLLGNLTGATVTGNTAGNIITVDPMLSELSADGVSTPTIAPRPGSPAIDAGDPALALATDQRGLARVVDGNGDGIARIDIGALEVRPAFVSNTADSGPGSLRQAIIDIAGQGDAIVLKSDVFGTPQTISLTTGELAIPANANFTLDGGGADRLTIDAKNHGRAFYIAGGATVTLRGLTVQGGNGTGAVNSGSGGGIYSLGNLKLENAVVTTNTALLNGGGVASRDASLSISNSYIKENTANGPGGGGLSVQGGSAAVGTSTIAGNTTSGSGGGVENTGASVLITNSTFSRNSAGLSGGGIANLDSAGVITLTNSTIGFNSAASGGGGVSNQSGGTVGVRNSIIALNTGVMADFAGALSSTGFNLIGDASGTVITGTTTGNITGRDPLLDPVLKLNGGTTPNHALLPGSPAIDAGSATAPAMTIDQRGLSRPYDAPGVPNAAGGNGSDIGAFELHFSSISGRVLTPDGLGLKNASVSVTDAAGIRRSVTTNSFGFYTIDNLPNDQYTIGVTSKRYRFLSFTFQLTANLSNFDFSGLE